MTYTFKLARRLASNHRSWTAFALLLPLLGCASGTNVVLTEAPGALTLTIDGLANGAQPNIELTGPDGYQKTITHSGTISGLSLGSYQVRALPTTSQSTTWTPTTDNQTITLSDGTPTASALVRYQLSTGALSLRIDGLPASTASAVHLSGPSGFALDVASTATLRGLAPGSYTLTAGRRIVAGATYLPADTMQVVNVVASLTPATAVFAFSRAEAALEVVMTGLPAGAAGRVTLTGPGNYNAALTGAVQLAALDPGSYIASIAPVLWQGHTWSPQQATLPITIDVGTNRLEIPYHLSTGTLAVDVEGLPPGVAAQFTVTGPDGFSQSGTGSREFVGIWPGTYTTTATAVVKDGKRYTPTRGSQNKDITPDTNPKHTKVSYSQSTGAIALTINGLAPGMSGQVIIIGPNSVDTMATSGTLGGLPDGSYTVVANPVGSGASAEAPTPTSQLVSVSADLTTPAVVSYAATTGSLRVNVSGLPVGASAAITVSGPDGYFHEVTGSTTLAGLAPGSYSIAASSVTSGGTGYTPTPPSQVVSVTAGGVSTVAIAYAGAAPTTGGLTVSVTGLPGGVNASIVVSGPGGYSHAVTSTTTLSGLAPGSYTVAAAAVTASGTSYTPTPSSATASVTAGATASSAIVYAGSVSSSLASLQVSIVGLPAGANGAVNVSWIAGGFSVDLGTSTTLDSLGTPGTYRISASTVVTGGGTYSPADSSQTVYLTAGMSATRTVSYSATSGATTGSLAITISGLPGSASAGVTVTGPGGYSHAVSSSTTLSNLATGTYTVAATSVSSGGTSYAATPTSQSASVTAGNTVTKSVTYAAAAPTTGALAISINGLPGGTAASVSVTGPGGYSQSVSGSTTLSNLATGTYTIAASSVSSGGTSYVASPTSQTGSVTAGGTTSKSVSYAASGGGGGSGSPATITVDTTARYQVMTGWEATAQAGQDASGFSGWQNTLLDQAVNDLGITRLRLEVKPSESEASNDNSNPNVINASGFNWSALDQRVNKVVLPLKQRVEARGERFYLNLNYVAFRTSGGFYQSDPAEYAEFILATFQHLQSAFGLVPDALEVILEPDNGTFFNANLVGQAIVATGNRLAAAGFHPDFIAPSVMAMSRAPGWFDQMIAVAGVTNYLTDISYHRYSGVSDGNLAAIASRAASRGLRTAMLEHIASGAEDLYKDLTIAGNSSWQQYTLAYPTSDDGAQYYVISGGTPVMASRTKQLWQYFHYVRPGAQRVGASSVSGSVRPVAFTNPGGGMAVVVHVDAAGSYTVAGLRPGTYEVTFTNWSGTRVSLPSVTATTGGQVSVSPTQTGVLTLSRVP